MTVHNVQIRDTRIARADVTGKPPHHTTARYLPIDPIGISVEYDGHHGLPISIVITGWHLTSVPNARNLRPLHRTVSVSDLDAQDEWIRDFVDDHAPQVERHVHGDACAHRLYSHPLVDEPRRCHHCTDKQLAASPDVCPGRCEVAARVTAVRRIRTT